MRSTSAGLRSPEVPQLGMPAGEPMLMKAER